MIWSLIKILIFIAAVAALAFGANWLLAAQGGVRLVVGGSEFTLGPLQSVIALLVFVLLVWICIKLLGLLADAWRFMNGDETAISRYFARNKATRGFDALAEGMTALASGDGKVAMSQAEKANRYLKRPDLTNLLTAQAAELIGDRRKAEETYHILMKSDSTRFVGVHGLMKLKLAEGNSDTALKLAERAFKLNPKHEETQDILIGLQANSGDWAGARETLSSKLKYGSLPRDVHKRRDAVLALSEAKQILSTSESIEAREEAIMANRMSPDLIPAAVMAAQSYIEKGQQKLATRLLKKAWSVHPHPDLAAAFAEIEPNETPKARLKRFVQLTKGNPTEPESQMLMAELYIAAEDFPEARRAIGNLVETDPTTRSVTLMAAIERGEGASDSVVQGWLARALTAPSGPQWICESCHSIHGEWTPTCNNCGAFDTLAWERPPVSELNMPGGFGMLPLLVGGANATKDAPDVGEDSDIVEAEDLGNPSSKAS